MKVTFEITDKRVTDLIHGHGGSYSPWLHEFSGKWNSPKGALAKYDLEAGEEGNGKGKMRIGRKAIERGLALMAVDLPNHWEQFMSENDDDITFDSIMQYCIFGKLVYG